MGNVVVFPKDVRAAKAGLSSLYGPEFERGVEHLARMVTRPEGYGKVSYVSHETVLQAATALAALNVSREFTMGVVALCAALVPPHTLQRLPNGVRVTQEKMGHAGGPRYNGSQLVPAV
jgi:hypothetical protein